jgi:hypothetical protein
MAPSYCLQAYAALLLRLNQANLLLEFVRKAYECIVIFAFMQLLVFHLGGFPNLCARLRPEQCHHIIPVRWFFNPYSWAPAERFVRRTLSCVLIYVPTTMAAAVIALIAGDYRRDYVSIISKVFNAVIGASQILAMYGLVLFYHANQDALAPVRPVAKLVTIKTILIFTIWQNMIVHFLDNLGFFKGFAQRSQSHWSQEEIAEGILNVMLCVEMFLLAATHHCVFPPGEAAALQAGSTASAEAGEVQESMASSRALAGVGGGDGPANCCQAFLRFCHVFDFRDILAFYRELCKHARTKSTDNLLEAPSRCSFCCRCCHYVCCRFFQGPTSQERAQELELEEPMDRGSTAAVTGATIHVNLEDTS